MSDMKIFTPQKTSELTWVDAICKENMLLFLIFIQKFLTAGIRMVISENVEILKTFKYVNDHSVFLKNQIFIVVFKSLVRMFFLCRNKTWLQMLRVGMFLKEDVIIEEVGFLGGPRIV